MAATPEIDTSVIEWLMDADPAIRWQVQRDLRGDPESVWGPERARIETEGWGARLLAHQDADGQWAGGAFWPSDFSEEKFHEEGQAWTATSWSLDRLREFGLDPASASARRTVELVRANSLWDHDNQPFWEGEVEECINGRTIANGAYFGVDVTSIVDDVLGHHMTDGGWNCERENGSTISSFDTTINVLEGLLEFERATGGTAESRAARVAGEEYLLKRHLFRRLSTGEVADEQFTTFTYPSLWRHDVLRGLDYFRAASELTGAVPDPRLAEGLDLVRSKRRADGRWNLDWRPRGRVWFDLDEGPGEPSHWVTLRAMRVLKWATA